MELSEKLELKRKVLHEVKGESGIIRHWGYILYAGEKQLLESVNKDLFTEICRRYNTHDKLLTACKKAKKRIREMGCDPDADKTLAILDQTIAAAEQEIGG